MFPGINPNLAATSIRPGAPGIPTISTITYTATQATIVFSPPDHNGGASIQSFVVISSPGGLTGVTTGSGGGAIVVNGLQPNTNYTFQIYAANELSTGTVRSSVTPIVTPKTFSYAPVVNSVVVNSSTQVTITYTAPTFTGGTTITSYTAVSSPGGITKSVATTASGTIVVTGLVTATNYVFTVYATNSVGTGATTTTNSIITFAILPDPPSFGTLAAPSSTVVNVPYTAPGYNGGSTITSYTAISTPGNITLTTSTSASGTFIFTGLTTATSYSFKVYATNIIGNGSSSTSNSITTPSVVPFNPILSTPIVTSATWITIPYTAPYTGGSTITSYTAISSPGGISATTSTSSSGVIVVKGLNPITAYTFNVYATNAVGNSSSSTSNSVTTLDVVPNAPTISSIVISPTTNAMNITYSVPVSNGGSAITSYTAVAGPMVYLTGNIGMTIGVGAQVDLVGGGGITGGTTTVTFGNVQLQATGGGGAISSTGVAAGGARGVWSQTNAGSYAGGINGGSGGNSGSGNNGTGGGGGGLGGASYTCGGNGYSGAATGQRGGYGRCAYLPADVISALALVGYSPSTGAFGGYCSASGASASGIGGGGGGGGNSGGGGYGSFGGGGGGAAGPISGKTYGGKGGEGWALIQYTANSNTTTTFVCSSRCITLPANVTSLKIWAAGGGGSGGNAPANNVTSGGGGAGGFVYFSTATSTPTATTSTAILNGSLQLYNLIPNTSYSVSVYATNNFGSGSNSAGVTTSTFH